MRTITSAENLRNPRTSLIAIPRRDSVSPSLPCPLTSFVGRQKEVAHLIALLTRTETRLVTLTGPGGVGKTRLALRVAEQVAPEFTDGVRLVSLASVAEPGIVPSTIALALSLRNTGTTSVIAQMTSILRDMHLLLILDNFEHVVEAAPLVVELLSSCPQLTVLMTSRTRLRLTGEQVHVVPPLELAAPDEVNVSLSPAVQLFISRAQAACGELALTDDDTAVVAAICRRLDGLPLAIELAAARLAHLSTQALVTRLEQSLPLLTGGPRDLPARQRTMRDTVAWSYDLLKTDEKALFRRLAVFAGGCTLPAAAAVCRASAESDHAMLDGIASLVDMSLLSQFKGLDGEPRYLMLETIREFAALQLEATAEAAQVRQRHADHYLTMVDEVTPSPPWPRTAAQLNSLNAEPDNLRATLAWLHCVGEDERFLRLTIRLWPLWASQGRIGEGRRWLERGLEREGTVPAVVRGLALAHAGNLASMQGDYLQGLKLMEDGLDILKDIADPSLEDQQWMAYAQRQFGQALMHLSRFEEAASYFARSLEDFRALGSDANVSYSRYFLGMTAYGQGDLTLAKAHGEAALELALATGSEWFAADALALLGYIACGRRDWPGAAAAFAKSFVHAGVAGSEVASPIGLAGVAVLAVGSGSLETAARLLGAAEQRALLLGAPPKLPLRLSIEAATTTARHTLGEQRFAEVWAEGRQLASEAAVETAWAFLDTLEAELIGAAVDLRLTPREVDVLKLVAEGYSDKAIAETLFIGPGTVRSHLANAYSKLGVGSRTAAVAIARRRRVL
jgi:predicted ATPase/DNA-binding CsgD family transcriptional regulator